MTPRGAAGAGQGRGRSAGVSFVLGETTVSRLIIRLLWQRPARLLGGLLFAGLAGAILVNALALQPQPHPRPIFTEIERRPAAAPVATAAAPPRASEARGTAEENLIRDVKAELAQRGFYAGPMDASTPVTLELAVRDYESAAGLPRTGRFGDALLAHLLTSNVRQKDPIRQLLRTQQAEQPRGTELVLGVQRALNKAGYGPLKEDGTLGPGTKAALERFERDRRLPVTGEPAGRTLQQLAAASGMPLRP